ncbi:cold-shock protein [Streptomyces sp. NRRL S-495]|uniref:cold-shock protein n=1 Tax=Streptomyces sp. NRRL S-495 TaxID=1609133 RepID=UPI0005F89DCE|nr:cold-shock protein [Streptomyces sp. NRRL S-495]KJY30549.1 cold-shock protein [Streptomyces sp. NRRL S-495]
MATGTVKHYDVNKGFGFIAQDDGGPDVFAHFSNIATPGVRELKENQRVSYDVVQGPRGPEAGSIVPE